MSDDGKTEALAEIFDCDVSELTPDRALETLRWDSMAMLGVIVLARTRGVTLSGATVRSLVTVADILALL